MSRRKNSNSRSCCYCCKRDRVVVVVVVVVVWVRCSLPVEGRQGRSIAWKKKYHSDASNCHNFHPSVFGDADAGSSWLPGGRRGIEKFVL